MSSRFTKTFLAIAVLAFGLSAQGITFKEALKKCQGQTTPQCQKVRAMYLKLKRAKVEKSAPSKAIVTPVAIDSAKPKEIKSSPETVEPKWDERGEIKSPFSSGYFGLISGIGKSDDDGNSAMGGYFHLEGNYATRWGATFYVRAPFSVNFSPGEDQNAITSLDPFFGVKGVVWSKGNWSFYNRLRLILPLSQSSVDKGITFSWGLDSKITYSGKGYSAYFQLQPRGQFFGFGEEDRNNGFMNVEIGLEGIKASENSAFYFYFASGFNREIGPDLGALVFTDDSSQLTALWGYDFNKHLTLLPGIQYNVTTKDTSLILWMWGALF